MDLRALSGPMMPGTCHPRHMLSLPGIICLCVLGSALATGFSSPRSAAYTCTCTRPPAAGLLPLAAAPRHPCPLGLIASITKPLTSSVCWCPLSLPPEAAHPIQCRTWSKLAHASSAAMQRIAKGTLTASKGGLAMPAWSPCSEGVARVGPTTCPSLRKGLCTNVHKGASSPPAFNWTTRHSRFSLPLIQTTETNAALLSTRLRTLVFLVAQPSTQHSSHGGCASPPRRSSVG